MSIRKTTLLLAIATLTSASHLAIASANITQIGSFGATGPGTLKGAEGIAVNANTNNVYVADKLDHRVVEYDQEGNFILTFGREVNQTKTEEKQKGNASITETEENVCTVASGNTCADGTPGSAPGQLDWPTGIAIDPNTGDVYISDGGNERIERYTPQGEYRSQIVSGQNGAPQFSIGVTYNVYVNNTTEFTSEGNDSWVDAEGNLYLRSRLGYFTGVIYEFGAGGTYTGKAFAPKPGAYGEGEGWSNSGPTAVAVDASGDVYVSERQIDYHNHVVKFDPDGAVLEELGFGNELPDPCEPGLGYALAVNLFTGEIFDVGESGECEPVTRVYSPSGQVVAELPALGEPSRFGEHPYAYQALAYGAAVGKLYQLSGGEKGEVVVYGTFPLPSPGMPTVAVEDWSDPGTTSMTVSAKIDPHSIDTTYEIEYGTAPELVGASSVPVSPADAGSGFLPVDVSQELTGLSQSTVYYYRVVAHSSFGGGAGSTVDGPIQSFTTLAPPSSVVTEGASEVSFEAAVVSGTVIPGSSGAASDTKWCFQYGTTEAPGYNLGFLPGTPAGDAGQGTGRVAVSVALTRLSAGTTYRYRLVAVNSLGSRLPSTVCGTEGGQETDGAEGMFTTSSVGPVPLVVSEPAVAVSQNAATLTGSVDPHGVRTIYYFQIGTSTSYGVDLFGAAGAGGEPEAVSVLASSLQPGTTYHYRLVASNPNGTSYGADESFTTPAFPSSVLSAPASPSLLAIPAIAFPSGPVASKTKAKKTKRTKRTKKRKKAKPKKGGGRKRSVRNARHRTSEQ